MKPRVIVWGFVKKRAVLGNGFAIGGPAKVGFDDQGRIVKVVPVRRRHK